MDDEYYEMETLEDSSESFDRLKKHAQKKVPVNFTNWRFEEVPSENKFILYKLDLLKRAACIPVSMEIIQKEVLEIKFYAENTRLDFEDINKMIGIQIRQFTCQSIDKMLRFFDEHTLVKGEASQPKLLSEEEKHQNLALFYGKKLDICRFCFTLENKSEANFHPYTVELQKAFEELALVHTKHKKAPIKVCDHCMKQLLEAHEARASFIASDKTLLECSQVILVNSAGQSSSVFQVKPGKWEVTIDLNTNSSSDDNEKESKPTKPSILKPKSRIAKH